MARLIRVETCEDCPYCGEENSSHVWNLICTKKRDQWGENTRILSDGMPDWCPLPKWEVPEWQEGKDE